MNLFQALNDDNSIATLETEGLHLEVEPMIQGGYCVLVKSPQVETSYSRGSLGGVNGLLDRFNKDAYASNDWSN